MKDYQTLAVSYFYQGYNCAQATALAFLEEMGCEKQDLVKLASSFGGGMGIQEVCGALTGALMAIGMIKGYDDPQNKEAKTNHYELIRTISARFEKENGSIICRELLEDLERNPRPTTQTPPKKCEYFVRYAASIVEDILQTQNGD